MNAIKRKYKDVFSDTTGKYKGTPTRINITKNVSPVIRRIPLHYIDGIEVELKKMLKEDDRHYDIAVANIFILICIDYYLRSV